MSAREKCLLIGNAIIKHKQNCEGLEVAKDMQLLTFRLMNFVSDIEKITPEGEANEIISHLLENTLQLLTSIEEFQEKHFLSDGVFSSMKRTIFDDNLCNEVKGFGKRIGSYITALARFHEENTDKNYFYEQLPTEDVEQYKEKSYTLLIIYNDNITDHTYTAEIRATAMLSELIRDLKEVLLQVPPTTEIELLNALKQPIQELVDQNVLAYFQTQHLCNQVTIRRKITKLRAAGYLAMASMAVLSPPIAVTALAVSYGVEKLVEKNSLLKEEKLAILNISRM